MDAAALYRAGQLTPAIEALGMELRKQPTDTKRRTFLFELLCFAGEYDRALKQLDILADSSKDAGAGAMLYRSALHAQRTREEMFAKAELPMSAADAVLAATVNGEAVGQLTDEDPRIGANLEVFMAGSYTWIPFRYIESVEIAPPQRLRDLLWATATLTTTPEFRLQDLGEVLLPVLAPLSWRSADDLVRLGRTTVWLEDGSAPVGQKALISDSAEFPLLTIKDLEFNHHPVTGDPN